MDNIVSIVEQYAESVWVMLVDSAFLLLVGIFLAGIIHIVLSDTNLRNVLKGGKNAVVLKSALFGVPLPLCSCSVLPVAHSLRESGLNKGATASFLVSTPETGVDSVLLTYSLMDPVMAVARPISAFLTALAAGMFVNTGPDIAADPKPGPAPTCDDFHCTTDASNKTGKIPLSNKFVKSLRYAFVDMLGDLSPYLVAGYLLAGVAAVLLGGDITSIPDSLRSGWGGYLGAIVVGLPLYICATSSTPLAAVLLAAGFSPGAIMVFLLVGPATNIASLTVVRKILGGGALVKYLAMIVVVAVLCGLAIDGVYSMLEYAPRYSISDHADSRGIVAVGSAIVFSVYITYLALRKLIRRLR